MSSFFNYQIQIGAKAVGATGREGGEMRKITQVLDCKDFRKYLKY